MIHQPYTEKEKAAIMDFRKRLLKVSGVEDYTGKSILMQQLETSDRACHRFLVARQFKLDAAVSMAFDAIKWRFDNKIDQILDEPNPAALRVVELMNHEFMHKRDKHGRTLHIEHVAKLDVQQVLKEYSIEEVVRAKVHMLEFKKRLMMNWTEKDSLDGRTGVCDQVCTVVNLKGISRSNFDTTVKNYLQKISKLHQDYNPEGLGKLFVINAPWFFSLVWKLIRGFLHERTQKKISIISGSGTKELMQVVNPENLPASLGGSCECEGGCHKMAHNDIYRQVCLRGLKAVAEEHGSIQKVRDAMV